LQIGEIVMGEISENQVTAALTFKVQKKVGWSVQNGEKSWAGKELSELIDCLAQEGGKPVTLSFSIILN